MKRTIPIPSPRHGFKGSQKWYLFSEGTLSRSRSAHLTVINIVAALAPRLEIIVCAILWLVIQMRHSKNDLDDTQGMGAIRAVAPPMFTGIRPSK